MAYALEVRDVVKTYGATRALKGVSLAVPRGAIHGLLGGNGSGKSTLIKVLAGIVRADAGEITLAGTAVPTSSHTPARAREVGLHFVHQQDSVFRNLSVAENLAFGRGFETGRGSRVHWRQQRQRAADVLERFGIDVRPTDTMGRLSSAQRSMIAIARALQDQDADGAKGILVLDEPTASLPHAEVDQLLTALRSYAEAGQTIVLVTHRIPEVIAVCTDVTVLRDGAVASHLEQDEISHDRLVALISDAPGTREADPRASPVALNGQRHSEGLNRRAGQPARESEAVLLDTEGVRPGGVPLAVRAGEIVGLAGLLGSGRSALLRALFGSAPEGQELSFRLAGEVLTPRSAQQAMRAGIALVPESRIEDAAFTALSVRENLVVASYQAKSPLRPLGRASERREAQRIAESFRVVTQSGEAPMSALSGGNQQKVILGRWLSLDPRLLLLDEPSHGVDVGARAAIHALVRETAAKGAAVLVASSEFEELAALCDRVVVVADGRITGEVEARPLDDEAILAAVYEQERSAA